MRYGLIGERLGHSFSKEIHERFGYEYELLELPCDKVESFMKDRDFIAVNVTVPYKETVIDYLDEISDFAKKIGAVNTVVNRDGRLFGYNTDFDGACQLVKRIGIQLKGKKALILGTGGTAKTMRAVLSELGAGEIINVSRTKGVTYEDAKKLHRDASFIVNTTPVGMYPDNISCPIDLDGFEMLEGVCDVVYNPLKTKLVIEAEKRGIPCEGGLFMLVAQAVYASAHFLNKEAEKDMIAPVFSSVLKNKKNIALIGMPTSGKTTVGKILSEALNREFADTDCIIADREGAKIPDIFSQKGEGYFRSVEKQVVLESSKRNGIVISTGGGVILDMDNVWSLRQNSVIFFLDRSFEKLMAADDRPLSSSRETLKARYEERYETYRRCADYTVNGDGTPESISKEIIRIFNKENESSN